MGMKDTFKRMRSLVTGSTLLSSPWAVAHIAPIEAPGIEKALNTVTRDSAMTIPALLRARNLICTTAARVSLIAERDNERAAEQPAWIGRTDSALSPFHRMLWTIDDLLFYGWSLWRVTRDYDGHVLTASRVPYDAWTFGADDNVYIGTELANDYNYILIPGIHEGILTHGREVIPQALAISRGVTRAVETPAATVELHQTNDRVISETEAKTILAEWVKARRGENGGVAFTNNGIEAREHGAPVEHLLVEGRNSTAIDIARLCSIPATMVDAGVSGSSINYSNAGLRMSELFTFGVAPLVAAINARLSMDDVVPRGVTIVADAREMINYLTRLTTQDDLNQPKDNPANDTI